MTFHPPSSELLGFPYDLVSVDNKHQHSAQLTSGSTTPQAATRLCSAEPKEVDSAHTYVTGGKHTTLLWREILEGVILLRSYAIHTPVPICHWSQANQPLTLRKLHPVTEGNHTYTGTPNV